MSLKTVQVLLFGAAIAGSTFAYASDTKGSADPSVKEAITKKYPNTEFKEINRTPISGLYEVVTGKNVFYVTNDGRYLVFGHVYDIDNKTDLTQLRKDELFPQQDTAARMSWDELPLDAAVVYGQSNGRKVAVFSDPDCPFCRRLHATLKAMKNVEVHEIMYPVEALHPAAVTKAKQILCAQDQHKALDMVMANQVINSTDKCDKAKLVDAAVTYGQEHGVTGTPLLVRYDGAVLIGARSAREIEAWLSDVAKAEKGGRK